MGVDVQTYRSRVGCFSSKRGAGHIPSFVDFNILVKCVRVAFVIRVLLTLFGIEPAPGTMVFSIGIETSPHRVRCFASCSGVGEMAVTLDVCLLVKLIGVVHFIQTLLIIAGIEQNPGPVDDTVTPKCKEQLSDPASTGNCLDITELSDVELVELQRKRVCLVKLYAWIKDEMTKTAAGTIANYLFENQYKLLSATAHESIHRCTRRREAVEQLLKKVLMGPVDIYDVFIDAVKRQEDTYIADRLAKETVSNEEIDVFLKLEQSSLGKCPRPEHHLPRLTFSTSDEQTLLYHLYDKDIIEQVNDHFLSLLVFSVREHTNIINSSLDKEKKAKALVETMCKCADCVYKDFCEILVSIEEPHVVQKLEKRVCDSMKIKQRKQRKSPTTAKEDEADSEPPPVKHSCMSSKTEYTLVSSLRKSSSKLQDAVNSMGFDLEGIDKGSIVIQVTPKNQDSWLQLEENCRTGKIKDFILAVYGNEVLEELMEEGEYRIKFTIYTLPSSSKPESNKAMFHLETVDEDQEAKSSSNVSTDHPGNLLEENSDLLCEELEITKDLLAILMDKGLVSANIKQELDKVGSRAKKIKSLLKKLGSHGNKGFNAIKDYVKEQNQDLYKALVTREEAKSIDDKMDSFAKVTKTVHVPSGKHRAVFKKEVFFQATLVLCIVKNDERKSECMSKHIVTCTDIVNPVCNFQGREKYNFRYQYLLVEIGTYVLRKLFDVNVGHDFIRYLAANKNQSTALQLLIKPKKGTKPTLTSEQAKLLPPLDNKPNTSNFDITLLSCLLRNVCGLKTPSDVVWMKPLATDLSEEADITRLCQCRNHLSHSGTVLFTGTEFTNKWNELKDILLRLNKCCGKDCITDLTTQIDEAKDMDIDDGLTDHFINAIKQSYEYEQDLIRDVARLETIATTTLDIMTTGMKEQQGMVKRLENVEQTMTEQRGMKRQLEELQQSNKRQHLDQESDVQKKLIAIYQRDCCLLQVSPFIEDDNEELICMYQKPTLHHTVYDKDLNKDKTETISSYKEIFCKNDETFKRVYITGDAGVGKTSLCRRMCLLWSMSKLGNYTGNDEDTKKDIKYLEEFDFLFHVSLGATDSRDMIMMIVDQLFYMECEEEKTSSYKLIKRILNQQISLIVLDGFDEWTPKTSGKFDAKMPKGIESEKCVFLTMCRPYKLENVRLSGKDIDHQVEMTGIHGISAKKYVEKVVEYMNKKNKDNKNPEQFLQEIKQCGLYDHLCIPMVSSHLIEVWWFNQKLSHFSKSLLYGKILEMLFKRTERKMELPSSTVCEHKLPDCFSHLDYIHEDVSLLQKVCLLAFNSLFKQDVNASTLVLTKRQLMASPYLFTEDEMEVVFKVGIISKNKVIGCFEDPKQKLSFVHKSYIEFFGALYVSSFDSSNKLESIVTEWKSLDDVLQYENFFQFLATLSSQKLSVLLENMYTLLPDHLNLWRKYSIFNYNESPNLYKKQLNLLQTTIVRCFVECSRSNDQNVHFKLEDFIFDFDSDDAILRRILLLNTTCVKSVYSVEGKYYDEFDGMNNLQCLHVGEVLSEDVVKFIKCMLNNQSTLHTVGIECSDPNTVLPVELPVRSLHQLTSLSLCNVRVQHEQLHDLVTFLSDNVHFEHIKLSGVYCDQHRYIDSNCTLSLNLQYHSKLCSLRLDRVNISCTDVNKSSLKSVTLCQLSERIVHDYINVFKCLKYSQLEHLDINGWSMLDDETLRSLTTVVKYLPCLKVLELDHMEFPSDSLLQLHCDMIPVKINLQCVTMSRQWFQCFIESCVNKKSVVKVQLLWCSITSVDGDTHRKLSQEDSVDDMYNYLTSIPTVNITLKHESGWLNFETTSCQ